MDSVGQTQFDFDSEGGVGGYNRWQEQRRQAVRQLSQKMGLPLGRNVEVWLRNDIRLVGILRLREEQLFVPEEREPELQLVVDNVPFVPAEIAACVVLE